jgi:hypothetical protein
VISIVKTQQSIQVRQSILQHSQALSIVKVNDHQALATCSLGGSLRGTGLSSEGLPGANAVRPVVSLDSPLGLVARGKSERPTEASEVAAAEAQAKAYAFGRAANGAGQKQTYHQTMWTFRGFEPWSHPA